MQHVTRHDPDSEPVPRRNTPEYRAYLDLATDPTRTTRHQAAAYGHRIVRTHGRRGGIDILRWCLTYLDKNIPPGIRMQDDPRVMDAEFIVSAIRKPEVAVAFAAFVFDDKEPLTPAEHMREAQKLEEMGLWIIDTILAWQPFLQEALYQIHHNPTIVWGSLNQGPRRDGGDNEEIFAVTILTTAVTWDLRSLRHKLDVGPFWTDRASYDDHYATVAAHEYVDAIPVGRELPRKLT